jgi:hypothetical protein
LNEIHLALKRTGTLVYWTPETEIRSRNDLTTAGYCKYYDAVVVVRLAGQDCKFALEYERTPKAARQYFSVRQRIEQETSIAHFLYLMPNYDLLWFVADKLSECRRAVHFGLLKDFLQLTLALPVEERVPRLPDAHFCSDTRASTAKDRYSLGGHCSVIEVSLAWVCGVAERGIPLERMTYPLTIRR